MSGKQKAGRKKEEAGKDSRKQKAGRESREEKAGRRK
jgi:hypothetical protein